MSYQKSELELSEVKLKVQENELTLRPAPNGSPGAASVVNHAKYNICVC
jgi:hypothetical protein